MRTTAPPAVPPVIAPVSESSPELFGSCVFVVLEEVAEENIEAALEARVAVVSQPVTSFMERTVSLTSSRVDPVVLFHINNVDVEAPSVSQP